METLILILLVGGLLFGAVALLFKICMAFDRGDSQPNGTPRRR